MDLAGILPWLLIGVSIALVTTILLQRSEGSLGSAFGGGESGGAYHTKRGLEKRLFQATIVLSIVFFALVLAAVILAA